MKKYITVIIATSFLFAHNMVAQTEREQPNNSEEKHYKQNQKKQLNLIKDKNFIIEANMVYDKDLNAYTVSSTTNFVKVKKDDIIIQLTFDKVANWNGIGGITIEGEIADYKVSNEQNDGPITVVAKIASLTLGMSTIKMTVFDDGMARAVLHGTFGQRITFSGHFLAPNESTVFKGVSKY